MERVRYEGDSPLAGRVYRIPQWDRWSYPQKTAFLRAFIEDTSRDPAIATKAMTILRAAGVQERDARGAWAAILKWVQQNISYQNEPKERFQSPQYTLSTGGPADCDDKTLLTAALGNSIRLPWKIVLSGRDGRGEKARWVEGTPVPAGFDATHIFLQVGGPPFRPRWWTWAEPSLDVPLGWDMMRDQIPANRPDIGAVEQPATTSGRALALVKKVPWPFVAASVIGSVLSFYILRSVKRGR
jgi:transglutaminase-like putative cysteine protease